jgi:GH18 family chitinase
MMKDIFFIGVLLIFFLQVQAQELHQSIHSEQKNFYNQFGEREAGFYDSVSGFSGKLNSPNRSNCQLQKIVFGFHPYWAGSDYLNYQWNLLSDFCYFSYEVDPYTGDPVTYHDWLSDPAVDSAKAHGVKIHLCATLFSGHSSFFTSMTSRQNLIDNLISLVQQRSADGINMDIEAVPSNLGDSVTSFMSDLSVKLKAVLPLAKVSIDLPAVDWDNSFNIDELDPYIDFFFVMGYDYYSNGSSQAGPVSPLYSLTSGYDYSLSRTLSAFESAGVKQEKFIMGIPYYGRQWKTQSNNIPSQILANGTALTYANIRNNSGGPYNPANYYWEPNSFSSCYIFFQNDSWNQCFIGLDRDLRKKYDIVNYRGLAGIGIWALGYDDGYNDLWQAISDKFTDCYIPLAYDTLYDSGGPAWNYYSGESYIMTIDHGFNDLRWLSFIHFNFEDGYDSLWLYAGPDTTSLFLGGFSGSLNPGNFTSPNGAFTIRFKSDPLQNAPGWMAVYHNGSLGMGEKPTVNEHTIQVYPNPTDGYVNIILSVADDYEKLYIYDYAGRVMFQKDLTVADREPQLFRLSLSGWPAGIYSIVIINNSGGAESSRFITLK